MKEKMNIKTRKYGLVVVLTLLIVTIGFTVAYFTANITGDGTSNVTLSTENAAILEFINDEDGLSINATMSTFTEENGNNLSDTITTSAKLTAESSYSDTYYMYFNISENTFMYTQDENTPELILKITDGDGVEITEIEGLNYYSNYECVSGFDITTKTGIFEILTEQNISVIGNSSTKQDWNFTLYFINLDANQNDNAGQTFVSEVIMQKEAVPGPLLTDIILMNEGDGYETVELAQSAIDDKIEPNFSEISTTDEGLYATTDNDGTSYYFRGATEDNYVEFAGILWRIVRIDGNGNIKLIYYSSNTSDQIYEEGGIKNAAFHNYSPNYNTENELIEDDEAYYNVKQSIDKWYTDNLSLYSDDYIVKGNYCVDVVEYTDYNMDIYYSSYDRLYTNSTPTLLCDSNTEGIYEYSYYAGIISADEVVFAGGVYAEYGNDTTNKYYYLYTGFNYWSLTAFAESAGTAMMMYITENGVLYNGYVISNLDILPTISLSSTVEYSSGNGTQSEPYEIVINELS